MAFNRAILVSATVAFVALFALWLEPKPEVIRGSPPEILSFQDDMPVALYGGGTNGQIKTWNATSGIIGSSSGTWSTVQTFNK